MKSAKTLIRERRHKRVRKKVEGTEGRPRLCVYRSNRHVYTQLIDDEMRETLVSASDFEVKKKRNISLTKNTNVKEAFEVGKLVARKALKKSIKRVSFDRGGFRYHGIVKSVADGAREGGLVF
jgi:large subunit ribosomal protein L18